MPAMEQQLETLGAGVIYRVTADLVTRLPDQAAAANARVIRNEVSFEAVLPKLIGFLSCCLQA